MQSWTGCFILCRILWHNMAPTNNIFIYLIYILTYCLSSFLEGNSRSCRNSGFFYFYTLCQIGKIRRRVAFFVISIQFGEETIFWIYQTNTFQIFNNLLELHANEYQLRYEKSLNVRQKLGTWKFLIFSNVFQCYSHSHSHSLSLAISLSHSFNLSFTQSRHAEQLFMSMLKSDCL